MFAQGAGVDAVAGIGVKAGPAALGEVKAQPLAAALVVPVHVATGEVAKKLLGRIIDQTAESIFPRL